MAHNLIVALLVAGCFVYALWTLAPREPRSRLAAALLQWHWPPMLQRPLTAALRQQGGCAACGACERSGATKIPARPAQPGPSGGADCQTITFVRVNLPQKSPR